MSVFTFIGALLMTMRIPPVATGIIGLLDHICVLRTGGKKEWPLLTSKSLISEEENGACRALILMLRGTGLNGATPLNGNVHKNEQERRKGRKTGDRDGLRVQEDLFLSS